MDNLRDPIWKHGDEAYSPEPPPTWRDHLDYASDCIRDAQRVACDDRKQELRLRLWQLDEAEKEIHDARTLLMEGINLASQDHAARLAILAAANLSLAHLQAIENQEQS